MFDVPVGGIHCAYFYPQACLLLRDKMAVFQGTCHPLQCNVVGGIAPKCSRTKGFANSFSSFFKAKTLYR